MKRIFSNNHIIYLMLLLIVSSLGCKKFLEKKSDSTMIVPTTLQDLQRLLNDGPLMNYQATPSLGESSADDYFIPATTLRNLFPGFRDLYFWNYKELNSINDWSVCYEKVYNANLCLERIRNIQQSPSNAQLWNDIKGSALFFRAYYFLQLAWNYGNAYDKTSAGNDLGISLRMSSDFNVPSVRATLQETYTQAIKDGLEAISYLPNTIGISTQPSKCAAYGLLARVYWSMRDYTNAFLYADSCLQLNSRLIDFNGDEDIIAPLTKNVPFRKFNKEIIFYTEMNKQNSLHNTNSRGRMDTTIYSEFSDDDLRKVAYFGYKSDGYKMFKANYTQSVNTLFTGIATDEMYLIRAEANMRMGYLEPGLEDLKTLMIKRWKTGTFSITTDITLEEGLTLVLKERRKELLMRGLRWIDLKRLNKGGANISLRRSENNQEYVLEPNSGYYALPLPEDIIRITGMPQNNK